MVRTSTLSALCIVLAASGGFADDWPQWLGPNQAAEWNETGLVDVFPAGGIEADWRVPVGLGYAGPAVADGRVFLFDYDKTSGELNNNPGARTKLEGTERLQCRSTDDGSLIWQHEYDSPYAVSYAAGPRAVPTVDGDYVYALGAEGQLTCLATSDGTVQWAKNLKAEYGVDSPLWGFAAAPVVDGDRLYVMVGGSGHAVVALNKQTGEELWRALSDKDAGYSTPTVIESAGVRQLIAWLPEAIHGLNPKTGEVLWSVDLKPDYGMSIMLPRHSGEYLFASGIGNVGAVLKLDQSQPGAEVMWSGKGNTAIYCANSTPLIDGDVIYGCDCRSGSLMAVDIESGERLWETLAPTANTDRRAPHGTAFLVKNGNRYFLFSETGDLVMARLSREKYEELGRLHLVDPTNECFGRSVVWSHPAFAEQSVFARNDQELVRVSLAK